MILIEASRVELERTDSPFVIFNDRTLVEMAQLLPSSQAELLAVNGVGQQKLAKYGDIFLNAIEQYINPQDA